MRDFADVPEKTGFSVDELFVAASCAGYTFLPCIKAELLEKEYDVMESSIDDILLSLSSQSAVDLSVSKTPQVTSHMKNILQTIALPERIVFINRRVSGFNDTIRIFFQGEKSVVLKNEGELYFFPEIRKLKTELSAVYDLTDMEPGDASFSIMLPELKLAKHLFDSFQPDSAEEYLAAHVGIGKDFLMNLFESRKEYILLKSWMNEKGVFERKLSDIVLLHRNQLYRACCLPNGLVSVKGISSMQFSGRMDEYLCD